MKFRLKLLERFKPIEHSLDIYSLTYAVSQFTRTSARKEQNSTNISKTTCQKLANEKRSLNSINYHNSNKNQAPNLRFKLTFFQLVESQGL